jgi:hypothetical protein
MTFPVRTVVFLAQKALATGGAGAVSGVVVHFSSTIESVSRLNDAATCTITQAARCGVGDNGLLVVVNLSKVRVAKSMINVMNGIWRTR